jgi:hypothetical protein
MRIRDAVPDDACAAFEVMRRSITELCAPDHGNDAGILERWLSNKTPETFRSWIRPGNSVLAAVDNSRVLAVGCIADDGTLNYVSPDARFRGEHDTPRRTRKARGQIWKYDVPTPEHRSGAPFLLRSRIPRRRSGCPQVRERLGLSDVQAAQIERRGYLPSIVLKPIQTAPTKPVAKEARP